MAEDVPINPEKNPAIIIRLGLGSILTGNKLMQTESITKAPKVSDITDEETQINISPPATDPGIRPIIAIFSPPREIELLCFEALTRDKPIATKQIGAGT